MVDLVYYLINLLSFHIPLLYYNVNLSSSVIFCLSSGYIYLSADISLSFAIVSELLCSKVLETFVILLVILIANKWPVTSNVSWNTFSEVVLSAPQEVPDYM